MLWMVWSLPLKSKYVIGRTKSVKSLNTIFFLTVKQKLDNKAEFSFIFKKIYLAHYVCDSKLSLIMDIEITVFLQYLLLPTCKLAPKHLAI